MGIADTLATVTPALVRSNGGRPDLEVVRRALYGWSFNTRARAAGFVPPDFARAVRWLESNTRPVGDLAQPDTVRAVMAAIGKKLDGRPAAATTSQRKRAVFYNALEYAVERQLLSGTRWPPSG